MNVLRLGRVRVCVLKTSVDYSETLHFTVVSRYLKQVDGERCADTLRIPKGGKKTMKKRRERDGEDC